LKKSYGLPDKHYISLETVKSRLKRKSLDPFIWGASSPLEQAKEAKEALVQIAISIGNVWQPLRPAEGLVLMNSLIKIQKLQDGLIEFKRRVKKIVRKTNLEELALVTGSLAVMLHEASRTSTCHQERQLIFL
jgi:hypothetical protein